jgi:acyl-coenzyme A synthetase/AMP-(fatty) acid ligase
MRFGEAWPNRHDLSSLRVLGTVGEPINPEAWRWHHRVIGKIMRRVLKARAQGLAEGDLSTLEE